MFSREYRLNDTKIFDRLFRQGQWARGHHFSVRYMPSHGKSGQIAFVVSTKITKKSHERNRIKRQLRAAFKAALQEKHAELLKKYFLVVVVHRRFADVSFNTIAQEVEMALKVIEGKK